MNGTHLLVKLQELVYPLREQMSVTLNHLIYCQPLMDWLISSQNVQPTLKYGETSSLD